MVTITHLLWILQTAKMKHVEPFQGRRYNMPIILFLIMSSPVVLFDSRHCWQLRWYRTLALCNNIHSDSVVFKCASKARTAWTSPGASSWSSHHPFDHPALWVYSVYFRTHFSTDDETQTWLCAPTVAVIHSRHLLDQTAKRWDWFAWLYLFHVWK